MPTPGFPRSFGAIAVVAVLIGCTDAPVTTPRSVSADVRLSQAAAPGAELIAYMDALNVQLESQGAAYRAAIAEYVTEPRWRRGGQYRAVQSRWQQAVTADFVPLDPRRSGPDLSELPLTISRRYRSNGRCCSCLWWLTGGQTTGRF